MENPTYHVVEHFDGPLDLLLSLIRKHKIDIYDIPIALLCDQYVAYLAEAEAADMELSSEFIVMASELMLIKSRMLLPRKAPDDPDPRDELSDTIFRHAEMKAAGTLLAALYPRYSGRMEKDTDEISPDRTFVADQDPSRFPALIHRLNVLAEIPPPEEYSKAFAPMMKRPTVPVEVKIAGIVRRLSSSGPASMEQLLENEPSLPDLVASFMGILELLKLRRILIDPDRDGTDGENAVHGLRTQFLINPDPPSADAGA